MFSETADQSAIIVHFERSAQKLCRQRLKIWINTSPLCQTPTKKTVASIITILKSSESDKGNAYVKKTAAAPRLIVPKSCSVGWSRSFILFNNLANHPHNSKIRYIRLYRSILSLNHRPYNDKQRQHRVICLQPYMQ